MTAERTRRPLLEASGLAKSYRGVRACEDISFEVAAGEIHALLGENGAGKSTLVKMIYGVVQPDSGAMTIDGRAYRPLRPSQARAAGIGMVFQHFSLFESLTVAENIALGLEPGEADAGLADRIVEVSRGYGLELEPDRQVGRLSVGQRQRVEIVRCLLQNPRLIIMDEPTSVLTPAEVATMFETLRRLSAQGCAILYISHKLEEIRQLCDRATVLRAGRVVATCAPAQETARSLAELMLGAAPSAARRAAAGREVTAGQHPRPLLLIDRLTVPSTDPFGVSLDGISLAVAPGEIVGIAGVAGNGQGELMAALIGETPGITASAIVVDGVAVGSLGPSARRSAGLAAVPEERLGHGAVPDMHLAENAILSTVRNAAHRRRGFIDRSASRRLADTIISAFGVRAGGVDHAARTLSGGNLQKFIVGRELLQKPAVLVAAQPTWGVDAGAAAFIHAELVALARSGAAVVLISQDLDELLALCDRVAVLARGRLSSADPVAALTLEAIGVRMGGGEATAAMPTGAEVAHAQA